MIVREKINKLGKKDVESLIETAIAGCKAGFNSSMLKESRNNMLDYLFELDDYTLEQLYLRTF